MSRSRGNIRETWTSSKTNLRLQYLCKTAKPNVENAIEKECSDDQNAIEKECSGDKNDRVYKKKGKLNDRVYKKKGKLKAKTTAPDLK